jgi:predicted phage-related endonuclease
MQEIEELNQKIAFRQELSMHIKELESQKDEVEAQLKAVIGESAGIKTSEYKVTWKGQTSKIIDKQKMKEDEIYEDYLKESETRVLRITKNKGE